MNSVFKALPKHFNQILFWTFDLVKTKPPKLSFGFCFLAFRVGPAAVFRIIALLHIRNVI